MRTDVIECGFAQVRDAGEQSTSDDLESDFGKEALHLIEPAGMGWDKMQLPVRMTQQPLPHSAGVVSGVVVRHHIDG